MPYECQKITLIPSLEVVALIICNVHSDSMTGGAHQAIIMTYTDPKLNLLTLCPHFTQPLQLRRCLIYSILVLQHPC